MKQSVSLNRVQRALLASHMAVPDKGQQSAALIIRIDGQVDAQRLVAAFETVVRNSDALRTIVRSESATGSGIGISADVPLPSPIVEDTPEAFEDWCNERAHRRIELSRGCYDSRIAQHSDGSATWFLNIHHIVNDAFSVKGVLEKVEQAYAGKDVLIQPYYAHDPFSPPEACQASVGYWKDHQKTGEIDRLYGFLSQRDGSALNLTYPEVPQSVAAACKGPYRLLTPALTETVYWVFATAAYLHRVSGSDAFTLGMTVSFRDDDQFQDAIGPRFDVFPVPIEVSENATFRELHAHVAQSVLKTLKHAHVGANPGGEVDALVNLIPAAAMPSAFLGHPVSITFVQSGAIDPSHAMRLHVTPYGADAEFDGPTLALDVATDGAGLCEADQIKAHFGKILADIAASPDLPINQVDLLSDDERTRLKAFATVPEPTRLEFSSTLQAVLEGNDDVVLSSDIEDISGDALWQWVLSIATHLEDIGAPGRIGVELFPSNSAVALIYGTLLSGRAFVPIDPSLPEARRALIAELAELEMTFSTSQAVEELQGTKARALPQAPRDREAYVYFTSGSTGVPKGVPITLAALEMYLSFALDAYFAADERPRAPLFASLGFDLTLTTVFAPILAGGEIVTFAKHPAAAIVDVARANDFNWITATPSQLATFLRSLDEPHVARTFIVAGENFSTRLASDLVSAAATPKFTLINAYGPTEAVIGCMHYEVQPEDLKTTQSIPIGHGMSGVDLRVMDKTGMPVPPGAMGELWISHDGVFANYIGRSAEDSNICDHDGRRYYRSGDLVSWASNGEMLFLGRLDEQLKISGARIDPTEIEAALGSHPGIEAAVVRLWTPEDAQTKQHCIRCGLSDTVPGTKFDDAGVCNHCTEFDRFRPKAQRWFKAPEDLTEILDAAEKKATGSYSCMHLLSGGKASTFALYKIVELGHRPYVVSLDNGYVTPAAQANIERVVAQLGLDHEYLRTPHMPKILRDSLERHSNVCAGCYKTVQSLATLRAKELGIHVVTTGLSRSQLFETRLAPQQSSNPAFDPTEVDRAALAAKSRYLRAEDAVRQLLHTDAFTDDKIFSDVTVVDVFQYVEASHCEVIEFLDQRTDWQMFTDNGRSASCLINEAGVHVQMRELGYNSYAVSQAWDVRLGQKNRDESLAELDAEIDIKHVTEQLDDLGYALQERSILTAWFVPSDPDRVPSTAELRAYLAERLPSHAMPHSFTQTKAISLTSNGKVNAKALPVPVRAVQPRIDVAAQSMTALQEQIVGLWERTLGLAPINIDDDFFALGGDSLSALTMAIELQSVLQRKVPENFAFQFSTPRSLAGALETTEPEAIEVSAPVNDEATVARVDAVPAMTPIEEEIYLAQRVNPDGIQYNLGRIFILSEMPEANAFEASMDAAIARHVPLCWTYGPNRKRLDPKERRTLRIADELCQKSEMSQRHSDLLHKAFDLDAGPTLRVALQPLSDGRAAVQIIAHHVNCDNGSLNILMRDVIEHLETGVFGAPAPDYPTAFAKTFPKDAAASEAFWRDRPMGAPASLLSQSIDDGGPDGRYIEVGLTNISRTSQKGGPIVSNALAAAAAALSPVLDGDMVHLGLITGRETNVSDDVYGGLINTLPLELPVSPNDDISDLAKSAQQLVGEVIAHRQVPTINIADIRRSAGQSFTMPRYLVSIIDQKPLVFQGNPVEEEILHAGGTVVAASFFVIQQEGGLHLGVEYNRRKISDATARDFLANYRKAFEAACNGAKFTVAEAVTSDARPSLVIAPPLEDDTSVLQRILDASSQSPRSVAVVHGESRTDWQTLIARAEAICSALGAAGVERGDRIAIALPRGPDYVAAILAAMGCGAAYVPVDISYPDHSVAKTLESAKPRLVLRADGDGLIVTEDGINSLPWSKLKRTALVVPDPHSVAYVMHTFGSTGLPLGVPITHAQLAASTNARAMVYPEKPARFVMASSLAFDSSVVGLFWTLAEGGTLVLASLDQMRDPRQLATLLSQEADITLMVPTLYNSVLDHSQSASWPGRVILAGEACSRAIADKHFDTHPNSELTNEYGPTEGTVWALSHHVVANEEATAVPIGQPVPGLWAAIVDEQGKTLPVGEVGELVIGGAQVTKGYLSGSDEDHARLSAKPSSDLPAGPLFYTGDEAKSDGELFWFLGRLDHQLNVGGARLSPLPIEAVLEAQDNVRAAAVVAFDPQVSGQSGDAMIVAHIEGDADSVSERPLRAAIAKEMPVGQRPAQYVMHDRLPRLPNGKIDRRTIAQIAPSSDMQGVVGDQAGEIKDDAQSDAPTVDVAAITQLFQEALSVSDFGEDDNFFDYGGYSLLALRLMLRIEEAFDVALSSAAIYDAPTPKQLFAQYFGSAAASTAGGSQQRRRPLVIPYNSKGEAAAIFAIHNLEENGALFKDLAKHLPKDHPFYGVGEFGAVNMGRDWVSDNSIPSDIKDWARDYVEEILVLKPTGPLVIMGFCLGALFAYEVAQQLKERGRTPELTVMLHDLHAPLLSTRHMSNIRRTLKERTTQIRRAGWRSVPRFFQILPSLIERANRSIKRKIEIRQLNRALARGEELSKELNARKFIEDSVIATEEYVYEPFDGKVAVLREGQSIFYDDVGFEGGWGDLLDNVEFHVMDNKPFQSFMVEPVVVDVADVITKALVPSLSDVRARQSAEAIRRIQNGHRHRVTLDITGDGFLDAPREEQRDWLLRQRLREMSQDLDHLDGDAKNMVSAVGTIDINDRDVIELAPDEIMEDWQTPLMQRFAEVVAGPGGDILEVGFGRGILSDFIQTQPITSHSIVECNPHVIEDFHVWKSRQIDRPIHLIEGRWEEVTDQFGKYDGVILHTYPLSEEELVETLATTSTFAEPFFETASSILRPGGRFTYFTNEVDSLSRSHQRALLRHFKQFNISILDDLNIPEHSADAHWYQKIVVVEAIK